MGSFLAINCEDLAFGQIEPFSHKWRNFFEKTSLLTVSKAITKSAFRLFTTLQERISRRPRQWNGETIIYGMKYQPPTFIRVLTIGKKLSFHKIMILSEIALCQCSQKWINFIIVVKSISYHIIQCPLKSTQSHKHQFMHNAL